MATRRFWRNSIRGRPAVNGAEVTEPREMHGEERLPGHERRILHVELVTAVQSVMFSDGGSTFPG